MSDFVERCRREWRRLHVPDPVADEMAADLAADLNEAEAEGISAEEVLGSSVFDPPSFAAAWAAERGVIPPPPAPQTQRLPRKPLTLGAIAALVVVVLFLVVLFGAVLITRAAPPTVNAAALLAQRAFGDTKRLIGPLTHKEPKGIGEIRSELCAREYRVFRGVIQKLHQWPFPSRVFFHAFGGRLGDHRDWPTIDAWADRIAAASPSPRSKSLV